LLTHIKSNLLEKRKKEKRKKEKKEKDKYIMAQFYDASILLTSSTI
jgi:hypothetical protein